jgi:hypothetical protein
MIIILSRDMSFDLLEDREDESGVFMDYGGPGGGGGDDRSGDEEEDNFYYTDDIDMGEAAPEEEKEKKETREDDTRKREFRTDGTVSGSLSLPVVMPTKHRPVGDGPVPDDSEVHTKWTADRIASAKGLDRLGNGSEYGVFDRSSHHHVPILKCDRGSPYPFQRVHGRQSPPFFFAATPDVADLIQRQVHSMDVPAVFEKTKRDLDCQRTGVFQRAIPIAIGERLRGFHAQSLEKMSNEDSFLPPYTVLEWHSKLISWQDDALFKLVNRCTDGSLNTEEEQLIWWFTAHTALTDLTRMRLPGYRKGEAGGSFTLLEVFTSFRQGAVPSEAMGRDFRQFVKNLIQLWSTERQYRDPTDEERAEALKGQRTGIYGVPPDVMRTMQDLLRLSVATETARPRPTPEVLTKDMLLALGEIDQPHAAEDAMLSALKDSPFNVPLVVGHWYLRIQ